MGHKGEITMLNKNEAYHHTRYLRSSEVALVAVIAAIYALLVITLPFISFLIFQVRVADALIPLSIILGWPAVLGVTIGCAIANLSAPWGIPFLIAIDSSLGSLANFLASYISMKVSNIERLKPAIRFQLACFSANLIISIIVGSYLPFLVKIAFGEVIPLWMGWTGVFLGELVAINLLGYILLLALWKFKVKGIPPL